MMLRLKGSRLFHMRVIVEVFQLLNKLITQLATSSAGIQALPLKPQKIKLFSKRMERLWK